MRKLLFNKIITILIGVCLVFTSATFTSALDATSDVMILQGVLMDANGTPRPDGNYVITVSLHTDSTGGIPLWTVRNVPVRQQFGAFSVELKTDSIHYNTYKPGRPVYANITIDNVELKPRMRIASVPLATRARYADDGAGQVPIGSVTAFAGDTSQIPDGWLLCDGRLVDSESYPRLAVVLNKRFNDEVGEGPLHFRLPDMRGMIVVGAGTNRLDGPSNASVTPSREEGSFVKSPDRQVNTTLPHVAMHFIMRAR